MLANISGAVVTAVAGFLIAFINYIFSKNILLKAPEKYFITSVIRQVLQVSFFVAVYFIGTKTQVADLIYLLAGAAVGMTIPMVFFIKKLLRINDGIKTNKTEKGDDANG
jgi:hypothetical protein